MHPLQNLHARAGAFQGKSAAPEGPRLLQREGVPLPAFLRRDNLGSQHVGKSGDAVGRDGERFPSPWTGERGDGVRVGRDFGLHLGVPSFLFADGSLDFLLVRSAG